jgi:hypothetical protein
MDGSILGQTSKKLRLRLNLTSLVEWEETFPNCLLRSMAIDDSDHYPMLLGIQDNKLGHVRFHFEDFGPKLQGSHEIVAAAWHSVTASPGGCPFISLDNKFKAVARGLQGWTDKTIGNVTSQLFLASELLHQLEIANDKRPLSRGSLAEEQPQETHSGPCITQMYNCWTPLTNRMAAGWRCQHQAVPPSLPTLQTEEFYYKNSGKWTYLYKP